MADAAALRGAGSPRHGLREARRDATRHRYDATNGGGGQYALVLNRMSPSAHLRGIGHSLNVYTTGDTFNLCPADTCPVGRWRGADASRVAGGYAEEQPPRGGIHAPLEVVADVERILAAAEIEVGGVEGLVDDRDDQRYYYDVNALSNFAADAPRIVGFDPFPRLADYLDQERVAPAERRLGIGGEFHANSLESVVCCLRSNLL